MTTWLELDLIRWLQPCHCIFSENYWPIRGKSDPTMFGAPEFVSLCRVILFCKKKKNILSQKKNRFLKKIQSEKIGPFYKNRY